MSRTHANTCTQMHAHMRAQIRAHVLTNSRIHLHTCAYTEICMHVQALARMYAHAYMRSFKRGTSLTERMPLDISKSYTASEGFCAQSFLFAELFLSRS